MAYKVYEPIMVGTPDRWFMHDEKGGIVMDITGEAPAFDNDKWVADRKDGCGAQPDGMCIGGSEASVVAGTRPGHENGCMEDTFGNKMDSYLRRTATKEHPTAETADTLERFYIGHAFEDAVAHVAAEKIQEEVFAEKGLRVKLVNDAAMYMSGNPKYPHAIADMDRIIETYDASGNRVGRYGLEIKTTNYGNTSTDEWIKSPSNPLGLPEKYEVQIRHYMGVCNIDGFFIAVQEYSMKPSDLLIRFVPRDLGLEEHILDCEEEFIQDCINGIEPSLDECVPSKALSTLGQYATEREHNKQDTAFMFPDTAEETIRDLLAINEKIAQCKAREKKLNEDKAQLQLDLSIYFDSDGGEFGMVDIDGDRYFVRQNLKKEANSVDVEALEKANPELASRVIEKRVCVSKLNKADKNDIQPFVIEGAVKGSYETKITKAKR